MNRVQDSAQTRMIQLILDLFESHQPIPMSRYEDEDEWGNERTFRRMKSRLNDVWEMRRGTPLFEVVDAAGNPVSRGERFVKLKDKGLKTSRVEQMSVLPAFMQLLSLVKGTILEDMFEPRYREFRETLNAKDRALFDRTKRKFFFLGKGAKTYEDKSEVLDVIYDALIREYVIEINYRSKSGKTIEEKILPLTLMMFNNGLFLLCRFASDDQDGKIYTFALDNFQSVRPLVKEAFKYPLDFDPEKRFAGAFGLIHAAESDLTEVVLEYDSSCWVDEYLRQRRWTGKEVYEETAQGRTRMTMHVSDLREVKSWLLGIATEAQIVKPQALKKMVLDDIDKIIKTQSSGGSNLAAAVPINPEP